MEEFLDFVVDRDALKLEMQNTAREIVILVDNENHEHIDAGYRLVVARKKALVLLAIYNFQLGNNNFKSVCDAVRIYKNVL
jgi:hypothetical protein